jgi:hypothetical protein
MSEAFTFLTDTEEIPVCAYQIGANALNQVLWVPVKVTDEIQTTDGSGFFQCEHYPVLDIDGDGALTAADVLPRNSGTGVALYVGTAAADLDSNAGKFKLYSDAGLTTPVAATACKCTYYYALPISVDSTGKLMVVTDDGTDGTGITQPTGGVGVKGWLSGIFDRLSKVVLAASSAIIGKVGIVNAAGDRQVFVQATLGDQEDFANALATSGFMLQYNAITGYWQRFTGKVVIDQNLTANIRKTGDYDTQQTNTALWTPASGKKFVITDIVASTATAGTVTLLDDATIIREYKFAANGGAVENPFTPDVSALADNVLKVTTSAAMDCFIVVKGYEV